MLLEKFIRIDTRFINSIFNWLLPPTCLLCGNNWQNTHNICVNCQKSLPILPHHCPQCAQFLPAAITNPIKCGACLRNPPPFNATYALFAYEQPIISMIIKLKFQHQLGIAELLGELLAKKAKETWYALHPLPDLLIPIPLHPHRLRERGFNQSLEIAKPASKILGLPIDYQGIKRVKATAAQSGLSAAARKQNIANAFVACRDYTGLTVAILDDVITTGHTIMECSRTLKIHGAKHIDIWCCARRGLPK